MARYTKLPVMSGISPVGRCGRLALGRGRVAPRTPLAAGAAPALTGEAQARLERLRKDEERHQRQRIAVSQEFITRVDRFEKRLRQEMGDEESPLHHVTKLESGLDILRTPRRRT